MAGNPKVVRCSKCQEYVPVKRYLAHRIDCRKLVVSREKPYEH